MNEPRAVQTWKHEDCYRAVLLSDGSVWYYNQETREWEMEYPPIPECAPKLWNPLEAK